MFNMLKKIFKNMINDCERRRENRRKKQFKDGYDYAVNELISGRQTPIVLESYFYGAPVDDFDRGIMAAVQKYRNTHITTYDGDDRI